MFCILLTYKMTQSNNIFGLFKVDGEIYINLHHNVISTNCLQKLTKLSKMKSKNLHRSVMNAQALALNDVRASARSQCLYLEYFGFNFDGWSGEVPLCTSMVTLLSNFTRAYVESVRPQASALAQRNHHGNKRPESKLDREAPIICYSSRDWSRLMTTLRERSTRPTDPTSRMNEQINEWIYFPHFELHHFYSQYNEAAKIIFLCEVEGLDLRDRVKSTDIHRD